jgi:hypothetical protein
MERIDKCKLAIKNGFTYNNVTGEITGPSGVVCRKVGKNGYIQITVRNNKKVAYYISGHQFAWFFEFNEVVPFIDHVNQIKTDNSILNLRSVTKSQNAMNMKNVKGYTFCSRSKRYIAIIMVNYKKKQLGVFKTPEEASKCYLENKNKYHFIN